MYTVLDKTLIVNKFMISSKINFLMEVVAANFWQYSGIAVKSLILAGRLEF